MFYMTFFIHEQQNLADRKRIRICIYMPHKLCLLAYPLVYEDKKNDREASKYFIFTWT